MHCLPAHRGEEVSATVVDGEQSRVFRQAHNRMHSFRGLLSMAARGEPAVTARSTDNGVQRLAKQQRQHRISGLLERNAVTSQGQLVKLLTDDGVVATQATVSPRSRGSWAPSRCALRAATVFMRSPDLPKEQRTARGSSAARAGRLGGALTSPLAQPRRVAHATRLGACCGVGHDRAGLRAILGPSPAMTRSLSSSPNGPAEARSLAQLRTLAGL